MLVLTPVHNTSGLKRTVYTEWATKAQCLYMPITLSDINFVKKCFAVGIENKFKVTYH